MTPAPLNDFLIIARNAVAGLSYLDPGFNVRRVEWAVNEIEAAILPDDTISGAVRDFRQIAKKISSEARVERYDLEVWKTDLTNQLDAIEATLVHARPTRRSEILGEGW